MSHVNPSQEWSRQLIPPYRQDKFHRKTAEG